MNDPIQSLIRAYAGGMIRPDQFDEMQRLLRTNAAVREQFLQELNIHASLDEVALGTSGDSNHHESPDENKSPRTRLARWFLAAAAVVVVALSVGMVLQKPSAEPQIATITGFSGPLQWTGDGGRVYHELTVGTELTGGTVEGMAPRSWFELAFNDGSIVTISGNSMVTFSEHEQKELHLKEGRLSSNVTPQPVGKPMLIYTRSAMLAILGTRFEVEAKLATTTLNVSEGIVRVTRFSDGSTVDVPARHRVIAAADLEMLPRLVPDSVSRWKSQLQLGPEAGRGKWSPGSDTKDARLKAIPYTPARGPTIYTATFDVSRGDKPPVALQPASRIRVRGRLVSTHKVYFGVTVRHAGGDFAGRFQTIRTAVEFPSGQEFEIVLPLRDFRLDPSLIEMESKLPTVPFNLVVESIWCHTLDKPAGLEVIEVELIPPAEDASE